MRPVVLAEGFAADFRGGKCPFPFRSRSARPSAAYLQHLLGSGYFTALAGSKGGEVGGRIAAYELREFETFMVDWFWLNARGKYERDDKAATAFRSRGVYRVKIVYRNFFP